LQTAPEPGQSNPNSPKQQALQASKQGDPDG